VIPRNVRLAEAPSYGQPGVDLRPGVKGAQAFVEFAREMASGLDETLLSRVEDAGLNASAPPQQRWLDGWLVRTSRPARRSGRAASTPSRPGGCALADKLRRCEAALPRARPAAGRPHHAVHPAGALDAELAARG
jgi:hypothetical protein